MAGAERDRWLWAVRERVARAAEQRDPQPLFAEEADAELAGLLSSAEVTTDLEARHAAGWLYWGRATALPQGWGRAAGSCAGMLLLPVWAADPAAVPGELAAGFAAKGVTPHPGQNRDGTPRADGTPGTPRADGTPSANGPAEWSALCVAATIAAEGRKEILPADAPAFERNVQRAAEELTATGQEQEELLGTAIAAGTLALLATPRDHPAHPTRTSDLAHAFAAAARCHQDRAALDIAIRMEHDALKRSPADDPDRLAGLNNLGLMLAERYEQAYGGICDPEDLDEAIGIARDVLELAGERHPRHAGYLSTLGYVLMLRLRREGGSADDYDKTVELLRRAAHGDPQGPGAGHANLGSALVMRHEHTGDPRDLEAAIAALRQADALPWADPREKVRLHNTLGTALRKRSRQAGDAADLHAAVDRLRTVLADTGQITPRTVSRLVNPAIALQARYDRLGDPADLDEAVALLRRAADVLPQGHPERSSVLDSLAVTLLNCHRHSGDHAALEEAVRAGREAVRGTPAGHDMLGMRLLNLGGLLTARHHLSGDSSDIQEALECRRRAVELPGLAPSARATVLAAAGITLAEQPEQLTDPAALDEGISHLRAALKLTEPGNVLLPQRRHNLAIALMTRAARRGRGRGDLREARRLAEAAYAALPEGSPDRASAAAVLAVLRTMRLNRFSTRGEVDEVIALARGAVDATPPGHALRSLRLLKLGWLLQFRHELRNEVRRAHRSGVADDLAAAADAFREAARAVQCPASTRLEAAREQGRLWAAQARWREALEGFTSAVDLLPSLAPRHLTPDDQEFWLSQVVGLGADAAACAVRCGDAGLAARLLEQARGVLLAQSFDADSDLTRLREKSPELAERFIRLRDRLDSAAKAEFLTGPTASADTGLAGAAGQTAVAAPAEATGSGAPAGFAGPGETSWATKTAGPAGPGGPAGPVGHAAAHGTAGLAGATGPTEATAADWHADPARNAGAAGTPRPAGAAGPGAPGMPDTGSVPGAGGTGGAPGAVGADARRQLAGAWQELTDRIRAAHPELRLFRPVREWDEAELRASADAGPVVLVSVSEYGSCALLVTGRAIEAVPLPGVTPSAAAERTRLFQDALARLAAPDCTHEQSVCEQRTVRGVLSWLWAAVAGPVLHRLGLAGPPPPPGSRLPRIWWSPGSALGALPLHAAAPDDGTPGAPDLAVSSYTPTLRALRHAREREAALAARESPRQPLIVAVPEPDGLPPLHEALREAEQLAGAFPGARLLAGREATHATVAAALRDHPYVHFACHAMGDPVRPSAGRLVLYDHAERPLTVRELARLRLPAARLAYLSACDTLRTSPELADESVSIVSAFQMAGFPHAVGALWQVDDAVAARIARRVYEALRAPDGSLDAAGTAEALHTAVAEVRADYPATPSLWACLVHAGP